MDVKPTSLNNTNTIHAISISQQQFSNGQNSTQTTTSSVNVLGDGVSTESAQILQEVLQISDTFNRRVRFYVDTDSNRVIIRIVDRETNEVIRELPPEALVELHKKMKEAMGILGVFIDQKA